MESAQKSRPFFSPLVVAVEKRKKKGNRGNGMKCYRVSRLIDNLYDHCLVDVHVSSLA